MNRIRAATVAAAAALVLAACSTDPPSSDSVPSTSASSFTSGGASQLPPTSSASPTTPAYVPPPAAVETTPPAPARNRLPEGWDKDNDGQIDADAPIGDRGCDTAQCLIDKNQQGAQEAAQCANGAVVNEGGGNYSTCQNGVWKYVSPTRDPNSGDGYGPNQPLPPLCVRFPQDYQC